MNVGDHVVECATWHDCPVLHPADVRALRDVLSKLNTFRGYNVAEARRTLALVVSGLAGAQTAEQMCDWAGTLAETGDCDLRLSDDRRWVTILWVCPACGHQHESGPHRVDELVGA